MWPVIAAYTVGVAMNGFLPAKRRKERRTQAQESSEEDTGA